MDEIQKIEVPDGFQSTMPGITKYYVNPDGTYLGTLTDVTLEEAGPEWADGIEVPFPPVSSTQLWDFVTSTWSAYVFVPFAITAAQFWMQMITEGFVDEAEAEEAIFGTIPPDTIGRINLLPSNQRLSARVKIRGITILSRPSDTLALICQLYNWNSAKETQVFIDAGQIE